MNHEMLKLPAKAALGMPGNVTASSTPSKVIARPRTPAT
jgi:hypothetical protein